MLVNSISIITYTLFIYENLYNINIRIILLNKTPYILILKNYKYINNLIKLLYIYKLLVLLSR